MLTNSQSMTELGIAGAAADGNAEYMGLTASVYDAGKLTIDQFSADERRALGQYMTPPAVANFMAQRALPPEDLTIVRIVDPAAGTGVLAAAAVAALLARNTPPARIVVTLYEVDPRLIPGLRRVVARLRVAAKRRGVQLNAKVHCADFLMSAAALRAVPVADLVIANPPYFKLGGRDPRVLAHAHLVHGQPNIYALFMAVCARLVNPGGRWCFITPRSWTNGAYFSAARAAIAGALSFDAIHVFASRRDHFTDDTILQEAMITWATAHTRGHGSIVMSSSEGAADLANAVLTRQPADLIVKMNDAHTVVLPDANTDALWREWTATLDTYGLKVSTGPVVAFRASRHLRCTATSTTVPLLWMQHVQPMRVQWPADKKREHIVAIGATAWMLVPNSTFVVMRRFSPKEDYRRVVAAPYLTGTLPGAVVGLENHTNYIYRPGGHMEADEATGLAALLDSAVMDTYFRAVAGSTQVNASDLRRVPLPPLATIRAIGRKLGSGASLSSVDAVVWAALNRDDTNRRRAA